MKKIFLLLIPAVVVLGAVLLYRLIEMRELTGVVQDEETGAPIEGAELAVADAGATTNAEGQYSLFFPRGEHTVSVSADGYLPREEPLDGSDLFEKVFTVDLALSPNRVRGVVQDGETGQPLAQVPVVVGNQTLLTDARGTFEVRAVKNGTLLSVNAQGYQPAVVTFNGNTELRIALPPNSVAVVVADPAGQPVTNAQAKIGDSTARTDARGRAVLRRVKSGVITVSAPGYESATASFKGTDIQLSLTLRPNTLDGTVVDASTSRPISGTLVYLGNNVVSTNAQGQYHVGDVPAKARAVFKVPGYGKVELDVSGLRRRDVKLTPFLVKGIHIPFAAKPELVHADMDLVGKTELNAIVIDVKSEKGRIAWESQVPLAQQIGAAYLKGIDLLEVIERCRVDNIYCIARMPVFQDTLLATTRPNLALRYPGGTVYKDSGDLAWTDPANSTVWDYNIALAKEMVALGFDEIQFDYIRYPGLVDGLYTGAAATEQGRIAAITGFLARARKELQPTGVFVSADVFGLTTASSDEHFTGQRLRDLTPYLDYISPMVYPDVWAGAGILLANGLGIQNCPDGVQCPYEVIFNSYKHATQKTAVKVRLWLQAYAGRGNFGVAEYRLQRKAAMDAGSQGWMFWNGQGIYDIRTFGPPEPK